MSEREHRAVALNRLQWEQFFCKNSLRGAAFAADWDTLGEADREDWRRSADRFVELLASFASSSSGRSGEGQ